MLDIKILLKVLNPDYTVKFLYIILFAAFVPFLDFILIIMVSRYLGEYLFLAALTALSLVGFFISKRMLRKNLEIIRINTENNYYSEFYYNTIPSVLFISFLLILPGIIGTLIGLVLILPFFRQKLGKSISNYLKIEWKEIHEFLNVID